MTIDISRTHNTQHTHTNTHTYIYIHYKSILSKCLFICKLYYRIPIDILIHHVLLTSPKTQQISLCCSCIQKCLSISLSCYTYHLFSMCIIQKLTHLVVLSIRLGQSTYIKHIHRHKTPRAGTICALFSIVIINCNVPHGLVTRFLRPALVCSPLLIVL